MPKQEKATGVKINTYKINNVILISLKFGNLPPKSNLAFLGLSSVRDALNPLL
jgi:hypothetical protein